MRALLKVIAEPGRGSIEVRDVPYPSLNPQEVIVCVKATSICGSDLHFYHSEWPLDVSAYLKDKQRVFGHEFSGEIAEVGDDVKGFTQGDRVAVNPKFHCGMCYYCQNDQIALCTEAPFFFGAMSEYVAIPQNALFMLPEDVSYEEGALIEPFAVSAYAVLDLSSLKAGKTTVIVGPGPIGLTALMAAKLVSPGLIFMTGTKDDVSPRLELAEKLGADITINVSEEDPVKMVLDSTGGLGADFLYECAGAGLIGQGIMMLRSGGELIAIGHPTSRREIIFTASDYMMFQVKRLKILASLIYDSKTWIRSIELLKHDKIDLKPLITHRLPLKDAARGFELAANKEAVKVMIKP